MLRMIGQVSEGYNHFERVLVRRSCICEVVRAEESCKAQVFYFCDQSFPIGPGKAILDLNLYGYCYHVYKLLFCLFLALSLNAYLARYVKERTSTLYSPSIHLYSLSLGDVENQDYFTNVMEVVLEDQILYVDTTEEVTSDANPFKKLLKKEQRFIALLQEEQEAEARALERFQRAQKRLERRRKRVERIQGKLVLVREQIADQQLVYLEHEPAIATVLESTPSVDSEEFEPVHVEQGIVDFQESDGSSSSFSEPSIPETRVSEQEATSISTAVGDVL